MCLIQTIQPFGSTRREMQLIKKYANRKLYHTNRKQYITLEGIAQLVESGEHVQVLDNETGEDITTTILVQVILQVRKHTTDILPAAMLMSLVQMGGDAFLSMQRLIFSLSGEQERVNSEIRRRLEHLGSEGALSAEEIARLQLLLLRQDLTVAPDDTTHHPATMPSRSDIVHLREQVDALATTVEQLFQQQATRDR